MSAFVDISAALDANTKLLLLPTAWENNVYQPIAGTLYLRPTLLPAGTDPTGGDDASDGHIGIYQVDIIAPSGNGKGQALAVLETVANQFKRGTVLTYGSTRVIITNVSRTRSNNDGVNYIVGANIGYIAYTSHR